MKYYENIKQHRKAKGWTQQQLAEQTGVSRQTVTRWENGWNVPSLFYAEKLAESFGINVTELMTGENEERAAQGENPPPKKRDLLASAIWICALGFLPVVLHAVLQAFGESLRRYLILIGFSSALDYRQVCDVFERACGGACIVVMIALAVWWITRLVDAMRGEEDKYFRYVLYRQWNVGLIFILTNAVELCFALFSYVELYYLDYIGAAFIALFLDMIFDFIFKKRAKKIMIAESNALLDRIKLIYFILECVLIFALAAFAIIAFATEGGTAVMAVGLVFIAFVFIALVIEISYLIVRFAVKREE